MHSCVHFVNRVSLSFEVQGDLYWGSFPVQIGNAEAANLGVDKDLDIQLGSKTRRSVPGARVEKPTAMAAHVGGCCSLYSWLLAGGAGSCFF